MVSVLRLAPKARKSLFSLKKAAANDEDMPSSPTQVSHPAAETAPPPRSPTVPRSSTSAWIDTSSPVSSPTRGTGGHQAMHHNQSQESSSPHFQFPPRARQGPQATRPPPPVEGTHNGIYTGDVVEPPSHGIQSLTEQLPHRGSLDTLSPGQRTPPGRPRSRSSPADRVLALSTRREKARSHFSIPDVVVTAAEEDGEEVHFEVEVPADDRRMKLHNTPQSGPSVEKQETVKPPRREEAVSQQPGTRKSLSGKIRPFLLREPMVNDEARDLSAMPLQISIVGNAAKAPRSTTISGIFTKKDKKAKVSAGPRSPAADLPPRSNSPYGHPTSAFDSSGSLPLLSSKDSLPSSSNSSHQQPRTPPPTEISSTFHATLLGKKCGSTAVSPSVSASVSNLSAAKKKRKAAQKEEMALMKELAKVDKMVREHDAKARKAEMSVKSSATPSAFRRMTTFTATKRGGAKPVRTGSLVKRTPSNASTVRRERGATTTAAGPPTSSFTPTSRNESSREDRGAVMVQAAPAGKHYFDQQQEETHAPGHGTSYRYTYSASPPSSSDDSDERPSFSGTDWSAELPATTGLTSLAGRDGMRIQPHFADETMESIASCEEGTGDARKEDIDITLPREDSAVFPIATVGMEDEADDLSPASTWSSNIHRAVEMADSEEQQAMSASPRRTSSSRQASILPPLKRQMSTPVAIAVTADVQPPRPPRRQTTSPPTTARNGSRQQQQQQQQKQEQQQHTMSFTVGQIISKNDGCVNEVLRNRRTASPPSKSSIKVSNQCSHSDLQGGSYGGDEYKPFRAVMMSAGPIVVADRAGQRV